MKKLLLLSLLSGLSYAASRSVDPLTFDVAGVKLGMGYDEAMAAVAKSQGVDIKEIKPQTYPPKNEITGNAEPHSFELKHDHARILVRFTPDVEKNGTLAVSEVQYNIDFNDENVKALEEAVQAKYGEPSSNAVGGWRYCLEIDENELWKCKDVYNVPQLIYNHTLLKLSDPRLANRLDAWKKAQRTTKPKI